MPQLNHYNTRFIKHKFPITVVCDQVTNASNVGSLFRICDAFGIEKIIFCGSEIPVFGRKMTKTSRTAEKVVPFEVHENIHEVVQELKNKEYAIISLEITDTSTPIHTINFTKFKKIGFIIGNENFGVNETTLTISDCITHIEMFGQNSSMNVVQAANIGLYEITRQYGIAN